MHKLIGWMIFGLGAGIGLLLGLIFAPDTKCPDISPRPEFPVLEMRRLTVAEMSGDMLVIPETSGRFFVETRVGRQTIKWAVDTGATHVTMSNNTAKLVGIHLAPDAFTETVKQIAGQTNAAVIKIKNFRLGPLSVPDTVALVVPGDSQNLIGMSFLRTLRFDYSGGVMTIRK